MEKRQSRLNKFLKKAVGILFVRDIKCVVCDKELNYKTKYGICENCIKTLPFNNKKVCTKCGEPIFSKAEYCLACKNSQKNYEKARAPFIYEGEVVKLIYKFKYNNAKYMFDYLGLFLVDEYIKTNWDVDCILPVPLHEKRKKERGYNQSYLLSKKLEEALGIEIVTNNLIRNRETVTQTDLTKKQRKENLEKAFTVLNKKQLKNKRVLLIDDVFTTGATIEECTKTLLKAGVNSVYVLTLAHVKKPLQKM